MASEIIAGIGLFKTMMDMAKGLKDINDASIRNGAVIELQEKILTAQDQQATLINRVRELEKQMARHETWEAESQRYELKELYRGALAYAVKETVRGSEPQHYICANCYQRNKKSILQGFESYTGERTLTCPDCKTQVIHSYHPINHSNQARRDYDPFNF